MATRDIYINLRPIQQVGAFVKSHKDATALVLSRFYREARVPLRIFAIAPVATGGLSGAYAIQDMAAYSCKVAIGSNHVPLTTGAFVWNGTDDCFEGTLNLNTEQMNTALGATTSTTEISKTFEVRFYITDDEELIFKQTVTIENTVNDSTSALPDDVTASVFADALQDAIPATDEDSFERTGTTFALAPAVYRDFTLSDVMRVENPRDSGSAPAIATEASVTDTATVSGRLTRRAVMPLRVRGVATRAVMTGGETVTTFNARSLGVNIGGTPAANSVLVKLEVSSPAKTYYLNASTSGGTGGVNFDYTIEIVVDPGATLTLSHLVTHPDLEYYSNGGGDPNAFDTVAGVAPYPAAFDGEFVQVELADTRVSSYQDETIDEAGDTEIAPGLRITSTGGTSILSESRHHMAVVTVSAGAGIYTRTLTLLTDDRQRGDMVLMRLLVAGSTNPTVQIRNATSGGTLLATIAGTASATNWFAALFFNGSSWTLASIAPDLTTGGPYQPLDSDLTAIAALSTASYGRGLLTLADASAGRTSLAVVPDTDVQAYRAELAKVNLAGSNIASASSIDLGAATGDFILVTGTATITALGTVAAGTEREVRFQGALTLTHNGTSLILPTAANITTAADDCATFRSLGSGNWICVKYQRKSGSPVGSALNLYAENPSSPTTPVASGTNAVAIGSNNVASGLYSFVGGGDSNTAASGGNAAVVGGNSNTASGNGSFIGGGVSNSTTTAGARSTASGTSAVGNRYCGRFNASDTIGQQGDLTLTIITTDATQSTVYPGRSSSNGYMSLQNNSALAFDILLTARRTDADGENDAWKITGLAHRDANAASTVVDAFTAQQIMATAWSVDVTADTTNGAIDIKVTGEAAKTIRWHAAVRFSEVYE